MTGHRWVRHPNPMQAIAGGRDLDGTTIYVGRAYHEGDMVPAKVLLDKNVAYVSHGGQEHAKHDYEVLCRGEYNWEFSRDGSVPPGAIVAGQTNEGDPLYVGRVHHDGTTTVGKVHPSHGCLYIPFNGQEVSYRDYEVLVYH